MKRTTPFFFIFILALTISCGSSKKAADSKNWETITIGSANDSSTYIKSPLNKNEELVNKYAAWLHVGKDSITNLKLYRFVDKWLNTPYVWGGTDERGIDCSSFMQRLLNDVYGIQIPRTSVQQFFTNNVEPFHDHHYFSEGDLIFFSTLPGKPISHVGLYLKNFMFVNASSSKGVSIASLNDPYWRQRYVAAGRVKVKRAAIF